MGIEITTGAKAAAVKAMLYGPEGIGKSTWASLWPKPLYIDVEGSTCRMDVHRVGNAIGWEMVKAICIDLIKDTKGYKTLVIDTADWLDRMCQESVCQKYGWEHIEVLKYGKCYGPTYKEWAKLLDVLDRVRNEAGMHVVFLAHSQMKKQDLPDEMGSFDRYELKCSKGVNAMLKEWVELLLFCNHKTIVVEMEDKKRKAQGGKRVIYTSHHPCWDAKNRFDLPDEITMPEKELDPRIAAIVKASTVAAATKPEPKKATAAELFAMSKAEAVKVLEAETKPEPKKSAGRPEAMTEQLWNLCTLHGVTADEVLAVERRRGTYPRTVEWSGIDAAYQDGNIVHVMDKIVETINKQKGA